MSQRARIPSLTVIASALAALMLSGCGGTRQATAAGTPSIPARTTTLPGTGKPPVTIGDQNLPEQFVLGQLYYQALKAQGFQVNLNQNIGPTSVTMQALATGQLAMYPEYLNTWDTNVAGDTTSFANSSAAFRAGQRWALAHRLTLLHRTPFSDTDAIAVTLDYATEHGVQSISDLGKLTSGFTLGGPPQFQTQAIGGLPQVEQAYGVTPAAFKPLELGDQYQALDQGLVQAAVVNTTDGQLLSGGYVLLRDPADIFGWGNIVPVVSTRALDAEGPAFAATINRVSALLTLGAMRELNYEVEISQQTPATVAKAFLEANGLLPLSTT